MGLPEADRAQYLRSFDIDLSHGTKALNSNVGAHLHTVGKRPTVGDVNDPVMKRLTKLDCAGILLRANKDIKTIKGKLEQATVSRLKTAGVGDGAKGPNTQIEIYPECSVVCKVDVVDRKAPLRVHINYGGVAEHTKAKADGKGGTSKHVVWQKLTEETSSMYKSSVARQSSSKRPRTSQGRAARPPGQRQTPTASAT